jgi:hypothetical protein
MQTAVKERPILFSGPMVRAIVAGRKTQTRRVVKPQPPLHINELHGGELAKRAPYDIEDEEQRVYGWGFQDDCDGYYKFPYGRIGDRLWVRENFFCVTGEPGPVVCNYQADYSGSEFKGLWRPSIYMPRWASRILLEITDVRVEQLQDISEADAMAEGVSLTDPETETYYSGFKRLWHTINGSESWDANPWVWVVEFERD